MARKLKGGAIIDGSVTQSQLAQAVNDKANNSYAQANAAYAQANAAYSAANSASSTANNAVLKTGDTMTGNLTFSGTGLRILGDMSNATVGNRLAFQTSVANGSTTVLVIPNGTGTNGQLLLRGGSEAANDSFGQIVLINNTEFRIASGNNGTGVVTPMTFFSGGSERMRIANTGNVGIGISTADSKLHVAGSFRQTGATVPFEWTVNAGAADFYKLNAVGYADNLIVLNGAGRVGFGTSNPSTGGRVTIANNMGMIISHETAGVDIRVGFGNVTGNSNSYTGTVLGYRALQNSTPISYSTAIGHDALRDTTTGYNNTAVGYRALPKNTTGIYNTAVGVNALQGNITGLGNIGIGESALYTANTADYNTAVGHQAMYFNTTGYQNAAYGTYALHNNTTGYYNTAFGVNALRNNTTGIVNSAFGHACLYSNTTGNHNIAIGYQAAYYQTEGIHNLTMGINTGINSRGSYNLAIGNYALHGVSPADVSTSGDSNIAIGYAALYSVNNSAADASVAVGYYSLFSTTSGYYNNALGYYAGQGITTGIYNICIGGQAGYYSTVLTTGSYNIFIGSLTRGSAATAANQIVIGDNLAGVGDNYVVIGKSGAYVYNKFDAGATWSQTSDERLKKNIQNDSLGLSFINRLRPVTYNWKASNELDPTNPLYKEENDRDTTTVMHGLIAQEVKAAMEAEGCDTFGGWDEKNGIQSISREQFISPLINAVKELSAKIAMLEAEIQTLKGG